MFSEQYAQQWISDNTVIHYNLNVPKEVAEFHMLFYTASLKNSTDQTDWSHTEMGIVLFTCSTTKHKDPGFPCEYDKIP